MVYTLICEFSECKACALCILLSHREDLKGSWEKYSNEIALIVECQGKISFQHDFAYISFLFGEVGLC